ncbi:hypothetical protein CEXT_136091 [Caerostris extrusa]|uniref:Uncharacterized protein n=1 Tax=Caerostris extrusa TaxID=172846 RepID=A0AAV4RM69_CAEEX|nr:hypothetical protein CEXT_136091 [Caerostris extrusa]
MTVVDCVATKPIHRYAMWVLTLTSESCTLRISASTMNAYWFRARSTIGAEQFFSRLGGPSTPHRSAPHPCFHETSRSSQCLS